MSVCRVTYPRRMLERVSDRKKRRLAIDDSDPASSDVYSSGARLDSLVEVVEDSQTSLKGHRDLFGELIPDNRGKNNPTPEKKPVKKTTESKKKKLPYYDLVMDQMIDSPARRPTRVFIPTPRIMKIMKDAQTELYSLMGLNQSSSDVSVRSNDSLNVSGVHDLLDSSTTNARNENSDDDSNSSILKGKFVLTID